MVRNIVFDTILDTYEKKNLPLDEQLVPFTK